MALRKLVRRNYGGKSPVSIKLRNLHSFKGGMIFLSEYPWSENNITITWFSFLYNSFNNSFFQTNFIEHLRWRGNYFTCFSIIPILRLNGQTPEAYIEHRQTNTLTIFIKNLYQRYLTRLYVRIWDRRI